jgi:rhamnosyltransferase
MFGIEFEKRNQTTNIGCGGMDIDYLITSGSVVNLTLFDEIGGFDEALFIDEVDLEYCYRAKTKGYKIIKFTHIFLQHSLGKISYFRSLKSGKLTPRTLHSPLRVYYMLRNYLYVAKLYPNQFNESAVIRKKALKNRIKNNLLYGKGRFRLIKYIISAYFDYKHKKMGKIHQ